MCAMRISVYCQLGPVRAYVAITKAFHVIAKMASLIR